MKASSTADLVKWAAMVAACYLFLTVIKSSFVVAEHKNVGPGTPHAMCLKHPRYCGLN